MSYQDFACGRTAQQIATERELRMRSEQEAIQADEDELVGILRPLMAEEMLPAEIAVRHRWIGVR